MSFKKPYRYKDKLGYKENTKLVSISEIDQKRDEEHSIFIKPYFEDDYQEMETYYNPSFFSWGAGPSWDLDLPYTDWWDVDYDDPGSPWFYRVPFCSITCNDGLYCDEPITCRTAYAVYTPEKDVNYLFAKKWGVIKTNTAVGKTEWTFMGFEIYPATEWISWPEPDQTVMRVGMQHMSGAICYDEIEVFCYCNCPDKGELFEWDSAVSATTITAGETVTIAVEEGCGPWNWTVSTEGDGTFTLGESQTDERTRTNTLTLSENGCGTATISVTDDCPGVGAVTGTVTGPSCVFEWDDGLPTTIGQSSSVVLTYIGGTSPFDWTITIPEGSGFWLDSGFTLTNLSGQTTRSITVYTDGTSCGTGVITVTDDDSDQIVWYLTNTTGQWVQQTIGGVNRCDKDNPAGQAYCNEQGACTPPAGVRWIYDGQQAWKMDNSCTCRKSTNGPLSFCWTAPFGACGTCTLPEPPCGSPLGCGGTRECADGDCSSVEGNYRYYLWDC